MSHDTVVSRLLQNAQKVPDKNALFRKSGGSWVSTTWKGYADLTQRAARGFMALELQPGQVVSILSNNRQEWVLADMAAMTAGGIATGIYQTNTAEQVAYVLRHAESPIVVLENEGQLKKVAQQRSTLPALRWAIMLDGNVPAEHRQWALTWDELLQKAEATPQAALDARIAALQPDQLATLIYTSGTTGDPKGVMLSHKNLTWTADVLLNSLPKANEHRGMSYLPLSHIAEQMLGIHCAISLNIEVWFAESLEKLKENLPDCRPTVFFGVPRVFEKFEAALAGRFKEATGVKANLLSFARKTALEVDEVREKGQTPGLFLNMQYGLANKLVLSKLKAALGLDQCLQVVSGAAPIGRSTLDFFRSIDLPIHEVYGQSEGSGPTTLNVVGGKRTGTVGKRLPGIEVKIAEDGEILVSGGNIFMGYYKNPEATAETLKDGWMCSGDVGEFDSDGFLRITDRKKELLKTSGGKYIAPTKIEKLLRAIPEVSQAVTIGDNRNFCTALLTLEEAAANRWAKENGIAISDPKEVGKVLGKDATFLSYLQKQVDAINATLAQYESLKKFVILGADFSQEGGELTPTMKLRRKIITQKYQPQIEGMYS